MAIHNPYLNSAETTVSEFVALCVTDLVDNCAELNNPPPEHQSQEARRRAILANDKNRVVTDLRAIAQIFGHEIVSAAINDTVKTLAAGMEEGDPSAIAGSRTPTADNAFSLVFGSGLDYAKSALGTLWPQDHTTIDTAGKSAVEQRSSDIQYQLSHAEGLLDGWNIGSRNIAAEKALTLILSAFSSEGGPVPDDPDYSLIMQKIIRAHYRLAARRLAQTASFTVSPSQRIRYRRDRGIRIIHDLDDPFTDRIIYADGTVKSGDGTLVYDNPLASNSRAQPLGRQPRDQYVAEAPWQLNELRDTTTTLFTNWERMRSPRSSSLAVTALEQLNLRLEQACPSAIGSERQQLRTEINKNTYWICLMDAEGERPPSSVKAIPQDANMRAYSYTNGLVLATNATLNGQQGNWFILPDGSAAKIRRSGKTTLYTPDGRRKYT